MAKINDLKTQLTNIMAFTQELQNMPSVSNEIKQMFYLRQKEAVDTKLRDLI